MILNINGDVNRYFVQTLCMVYFPGSTFGKNEEITEGTPKVDVTVYTEGENVTARVAITLNDKSCEACESVPLNAEVTVATPSALAVGRALFAAGKDLLGYIPPWGILTGVRPAKIARALLKSGNDMNKSKRILRDEYFLNPQKAALAVSVASNESKLLKKVGKNTCSLYISIPFCPSRCAYCSFVSYTTPRLLSLVDEYIETLLKEIDDVFATIASVGLRLNTVYIGGGTPTTLSPEQLERLLSKICEKTDVSALSEFTLEAGRPDTITAEKLATAKKYGVTRISVNPQTLNDDILREIGRRHTVDDFYKAYEIAKNSGIRDINVDLIAGLPGDDYKNFSETMDKIIALKPTNITVHTFCVKKASDALRNNSGIYSANGGDAGKCVAYSQLSTKFAGYKPYYMYRQKNTIGNLENVGYSIEGHEGLYNIFMMEEEQTIFAVGAGAVTKLVKHDVDEGTNPIARISNPKYPYEYLDKYRDESDEHSKRFRDKCLKFFGLL